VTLRIGTRVLIAQESGRPLAAIPNDSEGDKVPCELLPGHP